QNWEAFARSSRRAGAHARGGTADPEPRRSGLTMSFVTSPVASIIVSNRFRKEPGDIQALAENIHEIGLLHPIAVTPDRRLIAGARRLMAFKYLGRTEIPVHVVDLDEIVRGEFAENVHRKSFLPSELDAIGQEISKLEAAYKQVQGQLNLDAKKNRPIVCPE